MKENKSYYLTDSRISTYQNYFISLENNFQWRGDIILTRTIPIVMNPLEMPDKVSRRRLLVDTEVNLPLTLLHLLFSRCYQYFILLIEIHRYEQFYFLVGHFNHLNLFDGCNWNFPLQLSKLYAARLFVKCTLGVEHKMMRENKESWLQHVVFVLFNQQRVILIEIIISNLQLFLKE